MGQIWEFLKDKKNQQVLAWLGGGAVVVVGGLWAAFSPFDKSDGSASKPTPAVEAKDSSIAVGGNVEGSTITIQRPAPGAPVSEAEKKPQ